MGKKSNQSFCFITGLAGKSRNLFQASHLEYQVEPCWPAEPYRPMPDHYLTEVSNTSKKLRDIIYD